MCKLCTLTHVHPCTSYPCTPTNHMWVYTLHTRACTPHAGPRTTRAPVTTHTGLQKVCLLDLKEKADLAPDSCVLFVVSDTCCDFQAASVPSAGEWGYSWPRPPRLIGVRPAACACRPAPYLHPNSRALPASSRPLPICAAVTLVALHPSLSHNGPHGGAGACECLWGPCVLPSSPDRAET